MQCDKLLYTIKNDMQTYHKYRKIFMIKILSEKVGYKTIYIMILTM